MKKLIILLLFISTAGYSQYNLEYINSNDSLEIKQIGTLERIFLFSKTKGIEFPDGSFQSTASESGIPDAPSDSKIYGRENENWVEVKTDSSWDEISTKYANIDTLNLGGSILKDIPQNDVLLWDSVNSNYKPYPSYQANSLYYGYTIPIGTNRLVWDGGFGSAGFNSIISSSGAGVALGGYIYGVNKTGLVVSQTSITSQNITNSLVELNRDLSGTFNVTNNIIDINDSPTTTGTVSGSLFYVEIDNVKRINLNPRFTDVLGSTAYLFDTKEDIVLGSLLDIKNQGDSYFRVTKDTVHADSQIVKVNGITIDGTTVTGVTDSKTVIEGTPVDSFYVDNIFGASNNDSIVIHKNIYVNGRVFSESYEAAAFMHPDSTITTSVTTAFSFLGGGQNNKFTNIYNEGFSFDGDTLMFNQDADDLRDSIEFRCTYNCESSMTTNNRTVSIGIFIKNVGGTYLEYLPLTSRTRTIASNTYYAGPSSTLMPVWLKDGDRIHIRAKVAATTGTLSTQSFRIYLFEE